MDKVGPFSPIGPQGEGAPEVSQTNKLTLSNEISPPSTSQFTTLPGAPAGLPKDVKGMLGALSILNALKQLNE